MNSNDHRARDHRAINNHFLWPQMLLPLKRYNGHSCEFAYMLNGANGGEVTIYRGNMFRPSDTDPKEQYADANALLDAGWEVD